MFACFIRGVLAVACAGAVDCEQASKGLGKPSVHRRLIMFPSVKMRNFKCAKHSHVAC